MTADAVRNWKLPISVEDVLPLDEEKVVVQTTSDAIPDQDVTLRTPSLLHPRWLTERRTFHIMDLGKY